MKITRITPFSGREVTKEIDVTEAQMKEFESPYRRKIQDIFPNLNPSDREFILTGLTDEDWDSMTSYQQEPDYYEDDELMDNNRDMDSSDRIMTEFNS